MLHLFHKLLGDIYILKTIDQESLVNGISSFTDYILGNCWIFVLVSKDFWLVKFIESSLFTQIPCYQLCEFFSNLIRRAYSSLTNLVLKLNHLSKDKLMMRVQVVLDLWDDGLPEVLVEVILFAKGNHRPVLILQQ